MVSRRKAQFFRSNIKFLGVEIDNDQIKLQLHIAKKILETPQIIDVKVL